MDMLQYRILSIEARQHENTALTAKAGSPEQGGQG